MRTTIADARSSAGRRSPHSTTRTGILRRELVQAEVEDFLLAVEPVQVGVVEREPSLVAVHDDEGGRPDVPGSMPERRRRSRGRRRSSPRPARPRGSRSRPRAGSPRAPGPGRRCRPRSRWDAARTPAPARTVPGELTRPAP
jgi:hypothetical protein